MEKLFELEKILLNYDTKTLNPDEFIGFMKAVRIVHEFNEKEFNNLHPEFKEVKKYEI